MRILILESTEAEIIHSVLSVAIGPEPHPKRALHRVPSSACFFISSVFFFSIRSFSSCLRLLPPLLVLSSITCFNVQSLRKMWPIQLANWKITLQEVNIVFWNADLFWGYIFVRQSNNGVWDSVVELATR